MHRDLPARLGYMFQLGLTLRMLCRPRGCRLFRHTVPQTAPKRRRAGLPDLARRALALAAVAAIQVGLGVATLLLAVPIPLALAHQATALVLFGLACAHWSATAR